LLRRSASASLSLTGRGASRGRNLGTGGGTGLLLLTTGLLAILDCASVGASICALLGTSGARGALLWRSLHASGSLRCKAVRRGNASCLLRVVGRCARSRGRSCIAGGSIPILHLSVSSALYKSLCRSESSCWAAWLLSWLRSSRALNTSSNTGLITDAGTNSLRSRSSGGHVRVDVGEDIHTSVLVDQVDVADGSYTLNRHLLELVDDILERPAGGKGAVGGNDTGLVAVCGIDDGLVVQLVDLGVESNSSGLLELNVVLNAGTCVEKVGDHGSVGHPVGNCSSEIIRRRSLAVLNSSAKAGRRVHGRSTALGSILGASLRALLLLLLISTLVLDLAGLILCLLTLALAAGGGCAGIRISALVPALTLSEWGSVSCGRKERGEENVLHVER
jgi:hypothetical protein